MLSIDYKGLGVSLFWIALGSAGNSKTKQRIELIQKVLLKFGSKRIKVLLADREFIGEKWFDFLIKNKSPFAIRVKKNTMVRRIREGHETPIGELLGELNHRKRKIINRAIYKGGPLYEIYFCRVLKRFINFDIIY